MNRHYFILWLWLFSAIISPAFAQEPRNLDLVKQELIRYHDSGEYLQDQHDTIDRAKQYLATRLANNKKNTPLAIVLDIDDTSISNYFKMLKRDFSGTQAEIEQAYRDTSSPAIQPTLELYRFAQAQKVAVFFISGRAEKFRQYTEHNLELAGFSHWNALIMRRDKAVARSEIENKGYDIVLNIGDQAHDLTGGHADKIIKMPNPYYK